MQIDQTAFHNQLFIMCRAVWRHVRGQTHTHTNKPPTAGLQLVGHTSKNLIYYYYLATLQQGFNLLLRAGIMVNHSYQLSGDRIPETNTHKDVQLSTPVLQVGTPKWPAAVVKTGWSRRIFVIFNLQ